MSNASTKSALSDARTVTSVEARELLKLTAVKRQRPVFLWGPPGIGKSELVQDIGDELGALVIEQQEGEYPGISTGQTLSRQVHEQRVVECSCSCRLTRRKRGGIGAAADQSIGAATVAQAKTLAGCVIKAQACANVAAESIVGFNDTRLNHHLADRNVDLFQQFPDFFKT